MTPILRGRAGGAVDAQKPTRPKTLAQAVPTTDRAAASPPESLTAAALPSPDALSFGAKGSAVKAVQELLLRLGYATGEGGADGDFRGATLRAVHLFQSDNGLPMTGVVDAITLDNLKAKAAVYPEYGEMMKDGVLQTTLGIGFDEGRMDVVVSRAISAGLSQRGFTPLDPKTLSDASLRARGFDPKTLDRNAFYYTKNVTFGTQSVKVLIRTIDRQSRDGKGQFATGMRNDDFIIYTGHGRLGSGPDFDKDVSAEGNFVIGTPREEGHYALGSNDLDKPNALSSNYQLMFFDGCNTKWFQDDFRQRPANKTEANLDLVLSNTELSWGNSADDVLSILDNVLAGKSMPDIVGDLERINATSQTSSAMFRADGFRKNKHQP